jgi:hypothetical protein
MIFLLAMFFFFVGIPVLMELLWCLFEWMSRPIGSRRGDYD